MFDFLKPKQPPTPSQLEAAADAEVTRFNSTQLVETAQVDMVTVVLRDLLRKHGIPGNWVGCEVHTLPLPNNESQVHIHLVIHVWSEALVHHTSALQHELMESLDDFEPHVDHTGYLAVWRFGKHCAMRPTVVPGNVAW